MPEAGQELDLDGIGGDSVHHNRRRADQPIRESSRARCGATA